MTMLEGQVKTLATILKDKNLQKYVKEALGNIVKAVATGDITALKEVAVDTTEIIFHMPTILFWDKMQRYLQGTFRDYSDQVKMAEKFSKDNQKYEEFVKKQIHLIDKLDDDKKVDYFATLTRCYLLTELEDALYYKLSKFINICTPEELEYIRGFDYHKQSTLTAMISLLYQYGLFVQKEKKTGGVVYVLSDFAKALKENSLNFDDGLSGIERTLSYGQIAPLEILEPTSLQDLIDRGDLVLSKVENSL